jgi:hypothetical protein
MVSPMDLEPIVVTEPSVKLSQETPQTSSWRISHRHSVRSGPCPGKKPNFGGCYEASQSSLSVARGIDNDVLDFIDPGHRASTVVPMHQLLTDNQGLDFSNFRSRIFEVR